MYIHTLDILKVCYTSHRSNKVCLCVQNVIIAEKRERETKKTEKDANVKETDGKRETERDSHVQKVAKNPDRQR